MKQFRTTALAIVLAATAIAGTAQVSKDPVQKPPGASAPAESMAAMDKHMLAMREMHEKFMRAKTAEERNALMAEQMKLMQDSMPMMGGMGMGQGGKGMGMGQGMPPADMAGRQRMMEKRMDMMQSMMQMMMDRMAPPTGPSAPGK